MAKIISRAPKAQKDFKASVITLCIALPIFAVVAYNNLSTAVIILGIAFVMVFVASPQYFKFFMFGAVGVGIVVFYISVASQVRLPNISYFFLWPLSLLNKRILLLLILNLIEWICLAAS